MKLPPRKHGAVLVLGLASLTLAVACSARNKNFAIVALALAAEEKLSTSCEKKNEDFASKAPVGVSFDLSFQETVNTVFQDKNQKEYTKEVKAAGINPGQKPVTAKREKNKKDFASREKEKNNQKEKKADSLPKELPKLSFGLSSQESFSNFFPGENEKKCDKKASLVKVMGEQTEAAAALLAAEEKILPIENEDSLIEKKEEVVLPPKPLIEPAPKVEPAPPKEPVKIPKPAAPKAVAPRPRANAPIPADYKKDAAGRLVCSKKNDKPSKSDKNKKVHMDMECCLDPDEIPNPHCHYSVEKYGKYLNK